MSKFKTGDKIMIKDLTDVTNSCRPTLTPNMKMMAGKTFIVKEVTSNGRVHLKDNAYTWAPEWLIPHEKKQANQNKMTNVINRLRIMARPEPLKSLVNYDIVDTDGDLTSQGQEAILQFIFEKHKTEFVQKCIDPLKLEDSKK